jgi:hypothetical protein
MNTPSGAAATTAETSRKVVPAFPEWKASLRARRVSASSLANAGGNAAHASAASSAARASARRAGGGSRHLERAMAASVTVAD